MDPDDLCSGSFLKFAQVQRIPDLVKSSIVIMLISRGRCAGAGTCGVGTCCGCSDEREPPYQEMIMLAGDASRVLALRGPTPFVAAERPPSELQLDADPVVAAATLRTAALPGLDMPQREAALVLSGRQQGRLTLIGIGHDACDRMSIVQLVNSTFLNPLGAGIEYVAMAVSDSFGGNGNVAVLLSRHLAAGQDQAQPRQCIHLIGFSRGGFSVVRQIPLMGWSESTARIATIGPALPTDRGQPAGIFALSTSTLPQEPSSILRFDLTLQDSKAPMSPVWNTTVEVLNGTQKSLLVGDVFGEQQQRQQFLQVWVAQTGGGRAGLTLTAVPQPECVAAGLPTHQRVVSLANEPGRRPWQAVTAAPWLASSSNGELQLIGTVVPPENTSDFVVSVVVYGSARHFATRARQLDGARSQFGWPTPAGIAAMPGQLNRSHANTNFFLVGPTVSYTNLIDHLINTSNFNVDGRQVVIILTLMPPPYANGRVPPDDPRTKFNETAAFDKHLCWADAERGAACGQHYENYPAWGEVAGRLGQQFPHLGGLCLEEFGNDTESGQVHHASLWPQTVATITASMRRYSPGLNFVGGFYFTDTGCHTGDSCANAKPLCCGQTRLFTYRPDLALAIDTVIYWFRNDGFIGGANPCAAGGWICDRLPPPYSQECVKTPSLCGCKLGPLAKECAWGEICASAPWACATIVGGQQGVGIGAGGLCTAGRCAEQTVYNAVGELELIAPSMPPGRSFLAGVYASPLEDGGQPSTKYMYDLLVLMLSQRRLGVVGSVIYDGYPSPRANETCDPMWPLSSEGCAVAAAYGQLHR